MNGGTWTPAYIGVGSNLADPRSQVARALDQLGQLTGLQLIARSRFFRSPPLGPQDQPDYVNAVAGVITQLDAHSLLKQLKELEKTIGRDQPLVRWGPRLIDFDLLVFGDARIASEMLTVPHPGIAARAFVVVPLNDIAPDLNIPDLGNVAMLVKRVDASSLQVL